MHHAELVEAAEKLVPLVREKARESELARRPLDEVIDAVRSSGLYSMMVPREYGGYEADVDTFFEVVLTLGRADASAAWLTAFYIEHNHWALGFPKPVLDELFREQPYVLAPVSLNAGGGGARRVEGGFRLDGQWSWGTCIVHADWVMPVAMVPGEAPMLFLLPRSEVELVDTWFVSGMSGTGSLDYRIHDAFVPEEHAVPLGALLAVSGASPLPFDAPIFQTPLVPILGFAVGLPLLGAAQGAIEAWSAETRIKIREKRGRLGVMPGEDGKPSVAARAALNVEAAELLFRDVLRDVMDQRYAASRETRSGWMSRIAHGVFMVRDAIIDLASVTGASGSRLDSPIQRALRDIQTASNHVFIDRESRYADLGRVLTGQAPQSLVV
jgi:alkylation response protein AidB-like acyl-CoA dehydrogenase